MGGIGPLQSKAHSGSAPAPAPRLPNPMSEHEDFKQAALDYHRLAPAGKIRVTPTKAMVTQRDLALAYSPGVAAACEAIVADPPEKDGAGGMPDMGGMGGMGGMM